MLHRLVEALRKERLDFGRHLAIDSKAIQSHARPRGKQVEEADNITYDCQDQLYCHCPKTGKRRQMVYWDTGKGGIASSGVAGRAFTV